MATALDMNPTAEQLAALNAKLDRLNDQVDYLASRQRAWDDLRADLAPVVREVYGVMVGELAQLEDQVTLEDIVDLGRKLLRNVRTISAMFDQLQSLRGLMEDLRPLSKEVFTAATEQLEDLEQRGYFDYARELKGLTDKLAEEFSPQDLQALAQDLPVILRTVRNLTRPDVLKVLNGSVAALRHDSAPVPRGVFGMLRALRDDEVRAGLGVALSVLKQLRPESNGNGNGRPVVPALEHNSQA